MMQPQMLKESFLGYKYGLELVFKLKAQRVKSGDGRGCAGCSKLASSP
jgi:hypothetical protein